MRESKKSEGGGGAFKAPPPDRIGLSWHPVYVVKLDSTVAKTDTTQIIRRGHIHLQNNHIK